MWRSIPRSLQALCPWLLALSNLRLWLSLLVLGLSFWTVGKLVMLKILHRSYQTPRYFIAHVQPENSVRSRISSIKVKIDGESGISIAEVMSDDPNLLEREFKFTLTTPQDIEAAIAQELEIPLQEVRSLIYYKLLNRSVEKGVL